MHPLLISYFKLIKKIFPSHHQGSVIGLDIGNGVCKAVEISRQQGSFEILRIKKENIENLDEKAALSKIVSAWDLRNKPRPIISAVSGKGTLIRYIEMPKMSLSDLKRAFVMEADKYLPFPKDTVYIDCFIFDAESRDKRMMVLIAAVKKELVDARLKLFKDCGLEATSIGVNSIAIANVFEVIPPAFDADENRAIAIVDISEGGTNLMILNKKGPLFNRDIFIGTQEVVRRVANIVGVQLAEAKQLLHSPGDKDEQIQNGVATVVANLVSEIRLSFDYFVTEKNCPIGQIVIVGDGASLPGVEKIFKESFESPVICWDFFEKVHLAADINKDELRVAASSFVTAFGLALNEYD